MSLFLSMDCHHQRCFRQTEGPTRKKMSVIDWFWWCSERNGLVRPIAIMGSEAWPGFAFKKVQSRQENHQISAKASCITFTQCWHFTVWYLHRTFVASCQIKPCGKYCPRNNRESKVSHFQIYLQNKHFMLAVEMLTRIREKITMFRKELWVSGCLLYLPF